jgi:hypothetical protein
MKKIVNSRWRLQKRILWELVANHLRFSEHTLRSAGLAISCLNIESSGKLVDRVATMCIHKKACLSLEVKETWSFQNGIYFHFHDVVDTVHVYQVILHRMVQHYAYTFTVRLYSAMYR